MPGLAFLYHRKNAFFLVMNGALLLYTLLPLGFAWQQKTWFALPLFLLFPFGFALAMAKELRDTVLSRPTR